MFKSFCSRSVNLQASMGRTGWVGRAGRARRTIFMGRAHSRFCQAAFSLLEVLVALGIASVALASVLSGTSLHMQRVARLEPRYRNLVAASIGLEQNMAKRSSSESDSIGDINYKVTVGPMPSDPRIDVISSSVEGSTLGTSAVVNAYRLRLGSD